MKTKKDKLEFIEYLHACTNFQVYGVYEKERDAGRDDYAELAADEAIRRGLVLNEFE